MDSNHRYPAPKAGAIAARRRPVNMREFKVKSMKASIEKEIIDTLFSYYPEEIEFISEKDPFRFLVTVILSASNTDESAEKCARNLFSVLPDPNAIASADSNQIEKLIWSGGLAKSKARSIKALASYVVGNGKIPEEIDELTKIPGIGEKTANCYLGFLSRPAVIVDTHFARVVSRLGLVDAGEKERDKVYKLVKKKFPERIWYRLSMVLNKHGRVYCKSRDPNCTSCPVSKLCPKRRSSAQ